MIFNVHLISMERGVFLECHPFDKEANPLPYLLEKFMSKRLFNAINSELRFTNANPPPYVDKFWKTLQMVKAWNYHSTSIVLAYWEICLDDSMPI